MARSRRHRRLVAVILRRPPQVTPVPSCDLDAGRGTPLSWGHARTLAKDNIAQNRTDRYRTSARVADDTRACAHTHTHTHTHTHRVADDHDGALLAGARGHRHRAQARERLGDERRADAAQLRQPRREDGGNGAALGRAVVRRH